MKNLLCIRIMIPVLIILSQPVYGQGGLEFAKKMIGSAKTSIRDSLTCAETNNFPVSPPGDNPVCRSFTYASPEAGIRQTGNVSFTYVFVYTDERQNIDQVSFLNTYTPGKGEAFKKRFKADYRDLVRFLDHQFLSESKKDESYENDYGSHQVVRWESGSFVYKLAKDEMRKKEDHGSFYAIALWVSRK